MNTNDTPETAAEDSIVGPDAPALFFSASTLGFYHSHFHDGGIPSDAVEITLEEHAALLAAESAGRAIGADLHGRPIVVDRPPPSPDFLADARDRRLRASHWHIAEDEPNREAWLAYRKQLRELDLNASVITWPDQPAA